MTRLTIGKSDIKRWCWYGFDAGNSAHALLVSTVGFALYFKSVLFHNAPEADTLWGILTAIVLAASGLMSPFLTSWLGFHRLRWLGLLITTIGCVVATALLAMPWSLPLAISFYFISAVGYYLALPIYTSYLGEWSDKNPDKMSSRGWSIGYVGGIIVAAIAFSLGLLTHPITDRPDLYRMLFLLAGGFNLILSLPMLIFVFGSRNEDASSRIQEEQWCLSHVFEIFLDKPKLLRLLVSYWMVGECGTITVYFTAIFLAKYAGISAARIFALTLIVQFIAVISTWQVGNLSYRFGRKPVYNAICLLWVLVPVLLWLISQGVTYWFALAAIGLVLGTHHSIIRSEVADIASDEPRLAAQGSIYGFLEVTGRISSVLGPLVIAILSVFLPLSESLLVACIFPFIALVVIARYQWVPKPSSVS